MGEEGAIIETPPHNSATLIICNLGFRAAQIHTQQLCCHVEPETQIHSE